MMMMMKVEEYFHSHSCELGVGCLVGFLFDLCLSCFVGSDSDLFLFHFINICLPTVKCIGSILKVNSNICMCHHYFASQSLALPLVFFCFCF